MADKSTVIYAGRTMQDAHLLRNLLADEGIQALVINDLLQGGSGVDIVGWPTAARVVVAEQDAPRPGSLWNSTAAPPPRPRRMPRPRRTSPRPTLPRSLRVSLPPTGQLVRSAGRGG